MTEPVSEIQKNVKTPGIVIFAAILSFVSVALLFMVALVSLVGLIFGNVMGLYDFVSRQISQYTPAPNFTYGITFIFTLVLVASATFTACSITLGVCLLKGKRLAWYFQVAMSVMGLFGFPFGTLINGVILFFFFRPNVRDYFKV